MTQADKAVKRWQLEYGRTRKRVEDFSSQLDAARQAFAQISHDSVADEGLDITAVADAMTQAEKKVLALETALRFAIQRDEAAQAALRDAAQHEKIEKEVAAVAQLKRVFLKVDQLFLDLARLTVDEAGPALNAARLILTNSGILEGERNFLTEAPLEYKRHLLFAVHPLIREGYVPVNLMKYERVSHE